MLAQQLHKIEALLGRLGPEAQAALAAIERVLHIPKGQYLLRQDEVCRASFWLEAGAVRKYYLHEGREITTELVFSGDLVLSMHSYTTGAPSHEFIQAIADTRARATDRTAFEALKTRFPQLLQLDLLLTEYYALWLEQRLFDFHTLDATERYRKLLREQAQIVQQVPLTHIASYLGISLETLSRIRARII
jgi:CRP-like cAMP-binding protein